MDTKVADFKAILLKLASPEKILSWSHGEIIKPETINYRTQRPERDGLFDERIFGPEKDFECYCGKYRRVRYKGIICDKCGVEVTRSIVRRERMGHIALASPVSHIWFLRGVPSKIGTLLSISIPELEKVVYFAGYIITSVNEELKNKLLGDVEKEWKAKAKKADRKEKLALKEAAGKARSDLEGLTIGRILNEVEYHRLSLKYGEVFEAGIGAEALYEIVKNLDLAALRAGLEAKLENASPQEHIKLMRRIALMKVFERSEVKPEWMFLTHIPVIPPALRPMVQLDGGRHATSDVNDLYRRVINRNNRLKKLLELNAPSVIIRNEKRMLQEAVDALIDNSIRRGQTAATSQAQKRPLRSLSDMLKGKQGRFRQNLLGKRVDYSGRSVIVVGPELKLHQCGLPKHMALELFRPFVIAGLIQSGLAHNIRGAGRLIDSPTDEVWGILEGVIKDKYVLLNRAPTLHRLSIQAFQPVLIEGDAIQIHPLVCTAFNADFDGDQMAVHVPLTEEAQAEARDIMLSSKNLLKPGTGFPIMNPSQDMVLGCYWLTKVMPESKGEGKIFATPNEAILAHDFGYVSLQAKIKVFPTKTAKYKEFERGVFETSVGRLLFNSVLPSDFPFVNKEVKKRDLAKLVEDLISHYGLDGVPPILDKIKDFGFRYATRSGVSWGIDDLKVPGQKKELIEEARKQALDVQGQYEGGFLSDSERYQKIISIWREVKRKVDDLVPRVLEETGSIHLMVSSAARGSWIQVSQMAGMKGLVMNPAGKTIELPILRSYKEGLTVLEYFISTHGARKGTADTALKTSAAGYLTRRLIDVAQDLIIREEDCADAEGLRIERREIEEYGQKFAHRIFGRVLVRDLKDRHSKILFKKGHLLSASDAEKVDKAEVDEIWLRSPITCKVLRGLCRTCYGYDLGSNNLVKMGEAVGIVAAQAIGEPGTQLTMRTFHTGGVAVGGDITLGLPHVDEVFEMRTPSNPAVLSDVEGRVIEIKEEEKEKTITMLIDKDKTSGGKKGDTKDFIIPFGRLSIVQKEDNIKVGDRLSDGPIDIKQLFRLAGAEPVQRYILREVGMVYQTQGAPINDKHIELIIRQMFARVRVKEPGDTSFNITEVVERADFIEENARAKKEKKKAAEGAPLLMGISKVSLTTSSFLSAASFQETARVLINAAVNARPDKLRGLKENVIIGRLIPAGTSFYKYK